MNTLDYEKLPAVTSARLPDSYVAAKEAIEKCARLDEVKDWGDKAQALASYARQAQDNTLRKRAERIQARAIRRCGELLKAYDARPQNHKKQNNGTDVLISQKKAAANAGLSQRQKETAVRVGNVPKQQFEALVESDDPPTVTQLAEIGKKSRPKPWVDIGGRDPKDVAISTDGQGRLRLLADFAKKYEAAAVSRGAFEHEKKTIRDYINTIDRWLDELVAKL